MGSSRQEKDRKVINTSVRFTEEQMNKVKTKANENNMKVSAYIGYLVDKDNVSVTPEIMVILQNVTNTAMNIAKEHSSEDAKNMQREVDKLWRSLK